MVVSCSDLPRREPRAGGRAGTPPLQHGGSPRPLSGQCHPRHEPGAFPSYNTAKKRGKFDRYWVQSHTEGKIYPNTAQFLIFVESVPPHVAFIAGH